MNGCTSTYETEDGTVYECAGISCPISDWLGKERRHKAAGVDVTWTTKQARPYADWAVEVCRCGHQRRDHDLAQGPCLLEGLNGCLEFVLAERAAIEDGPSDGQ